MLEGGDVGPADSQSQTDTDCEAACMSQHHLNIGQKTIHYKSNRVSLQFSFNDGYISKPQDKLELICSTYYVYHSPLYLKDIKMINSWNVKYRFGI